MLNKNVKVGMPVTFKHAGVTCSGIVKWLGSGPDPSGAPVTIDHIAPPLQGHPTVTVDAEQLSKVVPPATPTPNAPPFTAPAAMAKNPITGALSPVGPRQYYLFCSYAEAQQIEAGELTALGKAGATEVSSVIVDATTGDADHVAAYPEFQNNVPVHNPPQPGDVSIWVIYIEVGQVSIPSPSPTIPMYSGAAFGTDVAGDLVDRELLPNQMDIGPTGIKGGDTLHIRFFGPTEAPFTGQATFEGYWNPAQQ